LTKHGCERVQKSVFVAAHLKKHDLERLEHDLKKLLNGATAQNDSLLVIPLRDEHTREIRMLAGDNKVFTFFDLSALKIIL